MTGRMVNPSLNASGFHFENIWEPIFKDLNMRRIKERTNVDKFANVVKFQHSASASSLGQNKQYKENKNRPPVNKSSINTRSDWYKTELNIRPGGAWIEPRPEFIAYVLKCSCTLSVTCRWPFLQNQTRRQGGLLKILAIAKLRYLCRVCNYLFHNLTFSSEIGEQVDWVCKKPQRVERHFLLKCEHCLAKVWI